MSPTHDQVHPVCQEISDNYKSYIEYMQSCFQGVSSDLIREAIHDVWIDYIASDKKVKSNLKALIKTSLRNKYIDNHKKMTEYTDRLDYSDFDVINKPHLRITSPCGDFSMDLNYFTELLTEVERDCIVAHYIDESVSHGVCTKHKICFDSIRKIAHRAKREIQKEANDSAI